MRQLLTAIPLEKRGALERALYATFPGGQVEGLERLEGGLSSTLTYHVTANGTPYVLQVVLEADALHDPARRHACMRIAADAGVAPSVHYTHDADGVSISDYIEAVSLFGANLPRDVLLRELADLVTTLHATPPFPPLIGFLDGVDLFIGQYRALAMLPEEATDEAFRGYARLRRVYPSPDSDQVSSHNDLHPGNLRYDGHRIWIIDWEAAFRNDRFVDLAILGKSFAPAPEDEEIFLRAYFGDALSDYHRARYFLMQQVTHVYYATIMLRFAAARKPMGFEHDPSMDVPSLAEFNKVQIGPDPVNLSTYDGQLLYGKVLLEEVRYNLQGKRFERALATVTQESLEHGA
jgi:aminoglycoside phosphotransferase (APT) family kinase protein